MAAVLPVVVALLVPAGGVRGEDSAAQSDAAASEPPVESPRKPSVGLDSLLRPRSTRPYQETTTEQVVGKDRATWKQAFSEARTEIKTIEARIEEARVKVAEVAGAASYQYNPLGGGEGEGPSDPAVLKLRAQLKRDKKELEAAEARFRDLQVEASLAGVPADWIESVDPPAAR